MAREHTDILSPLQYIPATVTREGAKRIQAGHPWLFKSHLKWTSALELAEAGTGLHVFDERGKRLATGYFNPHTSLCARLFAQSHALHINADYFTYLLKVARDKRQSFWPWCRWVHAEADGLPGLIVDVYGETCVASTSTAGMEALKLLWIPAIQAISGCRTLILKDDIPARKLERLPLKTETLGSSPHLPIEIQENGLRYLANPLEGQKTGWYYDQRANRARAAKRAAGKTVLDLFTHSGGFAIAAARAGASRVLAVDRSRPALDLARAAAAINQVNCEWVESEVDEFLEQTAEPFDIVIADPPPYIKSRTQRIPGLKGYEKLFRNLLPWVKEGGEIVFAACSHHARPEDLKAIVRKAGAETGRRFEIYDVTGADADHPVHPQLPESRYLTCLWMKEA